MSVASNSNSVGFAGRARGLLVAVITFCLATMLIVSLFLTGIERGMDHIETQSPESEQNEIAIAISEMVYGLHLGYIGFATVHDKLAEVWKFRRKEHS